MDGVNLSIFYEVLQKTISDSCVTKKYSYICKKYSCYEKVD